MSKVLFDGDDAVSDLEPEFFDELQKKLVHCTNHANAIEEKKKLISKHLGDAAKWYKEAGAAIAEAVKWKSVQALIDEFGQDYEEALAKISAVEPLCQARLEGEK